MGHDIHYVQVNRHLKATALDGQLHNLTSSTPVVKYVL
jgi:hypothetical protein